MIRRHANSRYRNPRVVLSHDGAALAVGINVTRYRGRVNRRARARAPTPPRGRSRALMRLHSRSRIVTVSIFKLVTGNQRLTWRNEGTTDRRVCARSNPRALFASARLDARKKAPAETARCSPAGLALSILHFSGEEGLQSRGKVFGGSACVQRCRRPAARLFALNL